MYMLVFIINWLFRNFKFVFVNVYIATRFNLCYFQMLRTKLYEHGNLRLYFSMTYNCASVLWQAEGACITQTEKHGSFHFKHIENSKLKRRALIQMYESCPSSENRECIRNDYNNTEIRFQ